MPVSFTVRYRLGIEALLRGEEVWFRHPNGRWDLSNFGKRRRVPTKFINGNGVLCTYKPRMMLGDVRGTARAVLETFVGPRPEDMGCLHADDNVTNNRLDNLRWGTKAENMADADRNGRINHQRRSLNTSRTWTAYWGSLSPEQRTERNRSAWKTRRKKWKI